MTAATSTTAQPPGGTAPATGPTGAVAGRTERRGEMLAGYALIVVPMLLFLVLNIGSVLYELFVSLWKWNVRTGPVTSSGQVLHPSHRYPADDGGGAGPACVPT